MRGKGYWAQEIGWNKDLVYVPCYYYFFLLWNLYV